MANNRASDNKRQRNTRRQSGSKHIHDNRKLLTVLAGACVAIAMFSLGFSALQLASANGVRKRLHDDTVTVVVASHNIATKTILTAGDLTKADVPKAFVPSDAITDIDKIVGCQIDTAVKNGMPLSAANIQGSMSSDDVTVNIAGDKFAIMLQLDDASGLKPLLHVSDHVDVYATSSDGTNSAASLIAENVRVVALDEQLSGSSKTYTRVTLEVNSDQASAIAAAGANIHLVARPDIQSHSEKKQAATNDDMTID